MLIDEVVPQRKNRPGHVASARTRGGPSLVVVLVVKLCVARRCWCYGFQCAPAASSRAASQPIDATSLRSRTCSSRSRSLADLVPLEQVSAWWGRILKSGGSPNAGEGHGY